jgi:hypothetical protein
LSTNVGDSFLPDIAVSAYNIFAVWRQDNAAGTLSDVSFRKSTNDGVTWGSKIKISTSGDNLNQPRIAVSGSNVYVVWQDDGTFEISFKRSTNNGATWGSIVNLSNDGGASFNPRMAVSGSSVYVVWIDHAPGNHDIFFKRSTNNGVNFGSLINVSNNTGDSILGQVAS